MTDPSDHTRVEPAAKRALIICILLVTVLLFHALPLDAQGLIDPRSGRIFLTATDLSVDGGPVTLEVRRSFDPAGEQPGFLGKRWRLNWEVRLVRSGSILLIEQAGIVRQYTTGPKGSGEVYTLPSGERVVVERNGRAARTTPDGLKETFDAHGRLIEREDRNGNRTTLRYDPQGRLVRIEGPKGSVLTLSTDKSGRVTRIEGSTGKSVRYEYDKMGRLTEVRGPSDLPTRYSYASGDQLSRIDDVQSGAVRLSYDAKGRVVSRRWEDGSQDRYEYDDRASRVRITATSGGVTAVQWSADGKRQEVVDPLGRKSVLEYDEVGRPLAVTGPAGGTSRISYDGLERTVAVVGPAGQSSRFEYVGESSRFRRIQQPGGTEQVYEYDTKGNLTAMKTGGIAAATITYDSDGSLAGIEAQGQPKRLFTYHPDGRLKSAANAQGDATHFEYDRRGNLIREVNPLNGITVRQYDAHDLLISQTDPAGGITRYKYDVKGRVSRLTDAGGAVTQFEYNAMGRRVADVNPKGQVTRYEYDGAGRLTRLIEPGNRVSTFRYDLLGNLVTETDPEGRTVRFEYDPAGRLQKELGPTGLEIVYRYDAAGKLVGLEDSLRTGIKLQRDPAGLLTAVVNPLGAVTGYEYDPFGNPLTVRDPLGRLTRFTYSQNGSLSRVALPSGDESRYEYDPAGRLTVIHHPGGGTSRFSYNAMGQLQSLTDPAGGRVERRYDPAGRLTTMTNAAGKVTTFSYDRSGRLTEKQREDGSRLQYQYDFLGVLTQADDGAFPVRFTYDEAGRLIRTDYPAIKRQMRYRYDQAGLRNGLIDSAGREIRYDYTKTGQLQAIVLPGGKRIVLTYDPKDRLINIQYPNGVTGQWEYDASGQTVAIRYQGKDGQILAGVSYRYDQSGNPIEQQDHVGRTTQFRLDALDQLVEATGPEGTARYRYLAGGNRARIEAAGTVIEYRYDQAGRLLHAGGEAFSYDPDGHLVSRTGPAGTTKYEYDPEGRLVKVAGPDETVTTFGYAPTGERVWKRGREGLRYFLYDALDLIQELAEDGSPQATYVHAPGIDRPLAMIRDSGIYYYHADRLGSVTHLTGEQGDVVASYDYDPFGRIVRYEGTVANPFTFTGREFDRETGLYYYRARYYDPVLGRFLSPDPAAPRLRQPLTLNPYLYAQNNPVRFTDPLGLDVFGGDWVNIPETPEVIANKLELVERYIKDAEGPQHEAWTRNLEEPYVDRWGQRSRGWQQAANDYRQNVANKLAELRAERARLRAELPPSPTPEGAPGARGGGPTRQMQAPRPGGNTRAMPRPGSPEPAGGQPGGRLLGMKPETLNQVVVGAATALQLASCLELGKSLEDCAIETGIGLAAGLVIAKAAAAAGLSVPALLAAGGYGWVKVAGEGSAQVKDLLDRRQAEQARVVQQQKNLEKMEAIIGGLEQKLLGELEGLLNNRAVAHTEACRAPEEAARVVDRLQGPSKQIDQAGAAVAQASNSCKDLEAQMAEAKMRAGNAKRYADLADRGLDWIRSQIDVCQSQGDVNKAVAGLEAAMGLTRGASQNYGQAESALARLREIQRASVDARKRLAAAEGILGGMTGEAGKVNGLIDLASGSKARVDELTKQIRARKAAMLNQVGHIRGSFATDATQVDERLKGLVGRLTAEEPELNTAQCITRASNRAVEAMRIRDGASAKVEGLKSIPLCDGISLPEAEFNDAARAMANMGLGGLGEGLKERGEACLARLKPTEKPVAGTGGRGSGKDDKGGSGTGGTGKGGPGQEPPHPPLVRVLSRFGVSCQPNKIKVGQSASCQAAGEYSDQPGIIVSLTGVAAWSPGPTIRGASPGSYFARATHEGASDTATVTVVEDEKKGPPDDGGKKPPDIKGATEAGTEFQGKTPGGKSPGPTSGAAGGGQPIEQPGLKLPAGTEPPTAGTGGPGGPGAGQWITCYSEKTKQSYPMPYGSSCPPPHLPPPTFGGSPHDPRIPWQGLAPPPGGGGGHGGGGGPKAPTGGGAGSGSKPPMDQTPPTKPKPTCGPATVCTCAGGATGHIPCDKAKGKCHCGGN
jgi:RHS repeat-associated protein